MNEQMHESIENAKAQLLQVILDTILKIVQAAANRISAIVICKIDNFAIA